MEIGLLGPVLVRLDGAEVRLASTPQRVILARLVLAANRTASQAALIETLWPCEPPANAVGNLQAYVSKLRQVIGADRIATAALLLAAAERDPLAPAVVGPDLDRQAALWAAVERGLGPDGAAAARLGSGRLKRATVAEHAIAALATFVRPAG